MDKDLYRSLLPLVNDKTSMELLMQYAEARIPSLHNALEQAQNIEAVRALQGRISELRRFKTLREEVLEGSK
jgi:hypothetical protein